MATGRLRVLGLSPDNPHGVAADTGPANMAWDEALLRSDHPATLRLYRWAPHTVSLGHFQKRADFIELPGNPAIVRRQTGGGAIWHGEELTFSLALDADLLPRELLATYRLIHGAVAQALLRLDCPTRVAPGGKAPHPRHSDPWCFAEIACGDLLLPERTPEVGQKLVGSAQRRIRDGGATGDRHRVLHHGSIPLMAPPRPAGGCGVASGIAGEPPVAASLCRDLAQALVRDLGAAVGMPTDPGAPDAAEAAMARDLETGRYGSPTFTERR